MLPHYLVKCKKWFFNVYYKTQTDISVTDRSLSFSGNQSDQDHRQAAADAAVHKPLKLNGRRHKEDPLWSTEADLRTVNLGINSAVCDDQCWISNTATVHSFTVYQEMEPGQWHWPETRLDPGRQWPMTRWPGLTRCFGGVQAYWPNLANYGLV